MPNDHLSQDNIDELETKLKQARKQKKKENVLAAAVEFVGTHAIHFISRLNHYVVKVEDKWYFLKPAALKHTYSEFSDSDFPDAFTMSMEEAGRIYYDCTYSFAEYPQTLNMVDASRWLKPIKGGGHHWIFDVLMQSLGCNKPENVEHLERVLTYKYLHPECWTLPCLVIYGEGGVGKNLLVDTVLYRLYAEQTISASSDHLVSTFNSLLKGRMAVLINETVIGRHDKAKLTNLLHKERIEINEKGIPQYTIDNTPLYLIGSNDWNGGALLDRSDADRRLSVMCCDRGKTLKYWIAKHKGWAEKEAQEWLTAEGGRICGNPMEIAHWLHDLIEKFGMMSQPEALHGSDYNELMDVQSKIDEDILHAVFMDEKFEYIHVTDLYDGYLALCDGRKISFPISFKLFNRKAGIWCNQNAPHIVKTKKTVDTFKIEGMMKTRVQKQRTAWVNTKLAKDPDISESNRIEYIGSTGYKNIWIGPEVV